MSNPPSVLPPNPYFPGIIYSPSDYLSISGNTVLTYAQASVLFIQKTIADTVTGITNFVNGITTSSILAKTISATCNLWSNATGVINIGTLNGRSAIIHIGDGDNNLAGSGVHINNGLNTASNVQILNGVGSTGILNLGSATSTTNVNSILTLAKPIVLGTSATVNTQLGFRTVILNNSSFSTVVGSVVTISSFTVPSDGAWLAQAYMSNGTQPVTYNLSDAAAFTGQFALSVPAFANGQLTYVLKGTGTIYFLAQLASVVSTPNSVNFVVTRIG